MNDSTTRPTKIFTPELKSMHILRILVLLLLLAFAQHDLSANVQSLTGAIQFKVVDQVLATLSSNGLGIFVSEPSANLHIAGNGIISNQMLIGKSSSSSGSNLELSGTIGLSVKEFVSSDNIGNNSMVLANSTSGNITLVLPYAGNVRGRRVSVKKSALENTVWISGGGNLIDFNGIIELPACTTRPSLSLLSDGYQWRIIDLYASSCNVGEVASSNLVTRYTFEETSGNATKDTGKALNDGYLQNGSTFATNVASGIDGQSLVLAGSDYIKCGNESKYDFEKTNPFSLTVWIKSANVSEEQFVAYKEIADPGGYNFKIIDAKVNFFMGKSGTGNNAIRVESSAVLQNNLWQNIAVTYSGNQSVKGMNIHINGQKQTLSEIRTDVLDPTILNDADFLLGNRTNMQKPFIGSLDDFRVYDKELTSDEVNAIYRVKSP